MAGDDTVEFQFDKDAGLAERRAAQGRAEITPKVPNANERESAKDSARTKKSVLSQGDRTNRQLTGRGLEEQSQLSHLISQRYLEPNGVQSAVPTPNQTII
jgi:hypothetical protein